jgi:hypothetical protein
MSNKTDTKQYYNEYLADTEPYVELHSSSVTSVPLLCSDTHSISQVNDGGSLKPHGP